LSNGRGKRAKCFPAGILGARLAGVLFCLTGGPGYASWQTGGQDKGFCLGLVPSGGLDGTTLKQGLNIKNHDLSAGPGPEPGFLQLQDSWAGTGPGSGEDRAGRIRGFSLVCAVRLFCPHHLMVNFRLAQLHPYLPEGKWKDQLG